MRDNREIINMLNKLAISIVIVIFQGLNRNEKLLLAGIHSCNYFCNLRKRADNYQIVRKLYEMNRNHNTNFPNNASDSIGNSIKN